MPTGKNPDAISLGAGTLRLAVLGSLEPATRAEAWDAAWVEMGYTTDGNEFSSQITSDKVEVAEELRPVAYETTGIEEAVAFALAQMTAENLQTAYNGGTITTTAGDVTFTPPALGSERRVMLGWDSLQVDTGGAPVERWIFRKVINTGQVRIPRKKGVTKADIPCEFRLEKPTGLEPWVAILAPARRYNAA